MFSHEQSETMFPARDLEGAEHKARTQGSCSAPCSTKSTLLPPLSSLHCQVPHPGEEGKSSGEVSRKEEGEWKGRRDRGSTHVTLTHQDPGIWVFGGPCIVQVYIEKDNIYCIF